MTLLARTAQAVYWAGRYLERAEDMSRAVLVHGDTHVDLPVGEDVGWGPLLAVAGAEQAFAERHARVAGTATEADVVEYLLTEPGNPSSILASLAAARDDLRVARAVVPREAWELCHDLWRQQGDSRELIRTREGRVRWLRHVIAVCQRLNGALWSAMRRDEALAFIRIGQHLERADLTCRMLAARAENSLTEGEDPYAEVRTMAVLRSLGAFQPFRRATPARPGREAALEFVLYDEAFPRAVAACLSEIRADLKRLPGNEAVLAACTEAAMRLSGAPVMGASTGEVRSLATDQMQAVAAIHEAVDATYFRLRMVSDPPQLMTQGFPEEPAPRRTYRVVHTTIYRYDAPAEQSYNEAHLRPRRTDRQDCLVHWLDVDPEPSSAIDAVDQFGNTVSTFVVRGGFDVLRVTATSEVAVAPAPEGVLTPPWETVRAVLERDRQAAASDARRFRAPSRLVPALPVFAEYATPSFRANRPFADAVVELCGRIHDDFTYDPGFTSVTTPLVEVFEARRGVCQDFAHLAIACLRAMGLAARYVSGYMETVSAPGEPRMVGADASHAWVSVYVPGSGWLDLDPTNDQLVSDRHIVTAWGRDYWDVSPVRGSVEGGGPSHSLEVAVEVRRLFT